MKKMVKISIIVPGYNEAKNLPLLFESIYRTLKDNNLNGEIIFTNDGSTDETKEVVNALTRKYKILKVYHHATNRGLTDALRTCFEHSSGDIICFLPADFESNPSEDIPKLLKKLNEGFDMVVGWRQNRKGIKIIPSKMYNFLVRCFFRVKIHDINWIKAFKKDLIKDIEFRPGWHRYIPILAISKGYKLGEVKVNAYKRKYGKSKFGFTRIITGFLDLLLIKFLLSFSRKPMFIFGLMGIFLFSLGFLGGIYLFFIKLSIGIIGNRMPLIFFIFLLMILGIQFFALGFIGELLIIKRG